ncbi:hypothetical protein SETIT_2G303700v2 [Setaria italica]|uniref:Uncharacterized protein n=1 Tax=Setaria italica TaxID=4555 RepID=A0A368Q507_SETIT|nr:hypothetical protein SETIT_2G303700v2 [Setaria italica]
MPYRRSILGFSHWIRAERLWLVQRGQKPSASVGARAVGRPTLLSLSLLLSHPTQQNRSINKSIDGLLITVVPCPYMSGADVCYRYFASPIYVAIGFAWSPLMLANTPSGEKRPFHYPNSSHCCFTL